MAIKLYREKDTEVNIMENEVVGIIGYGIQGRNQALNLRENSVNVVVYNRKDDYYQQAIDDGFKVLSLEELANRSTIIMMLVPDQGQGIIFDEIKPHIRKGSMLVVAHGYSIRFNMLSIKDEIDVILLAPRFPGGVLRANFLNNEGTLAFFDVYKDYTGNAKERGLALAKAIGFIKGSSGIVQVSLKEETEIDLFIEQFLIPSFLNTIQTGFDVLAGDGYTPEIALIELFYSGEIIGLLENGLKAGLYDSFQQNTSPTCQFGVMQSFNKIITPEIRQTAETILEKIKNGEFTKKLEKESNSEYPNLKQFNKQNRENELSKTQKVLSKILELH